MSPEGTSLAFTLTRLFRLVLREISDLSDAELNRELPFQPSNTLYQLGVHIAGSARWWTITNTGGTNFSRDRAAEFTAIGTGVDLFADFALLISQVESQLGALAAADLDRPVTMPGASISYWPTSGPLTQRDAVLHAVEHTGLHLGHIQLTRQVFGFAPPQDQE